VTSPRPFEIRYPLQFKEQLVTQTPRYIIRDRDGAYGDVFVRRLSTTDDTLRDWVMRKFKRLPLLRAARAVFSKD
jgi:hypothetical protein